jgi:outer membrane lipoprotein-sorting protein
VEVDHEGVNREDPMRCLIVAALAFLAPQEKNEAAELFRKMEEKFTAAKSLQLQWKVTAVAIEGDLSAEGIILLDEGNKARFEMQANHPGGEQKDLFVSDGAQFKTTGARGATVDTPATLNKTVLGCLARGGALQALTVINMKFHVKEADASKLLALSDFAMGYKEKVGEREAQLIEFKSVLVPAGKQEAATKLWIDCETGLPVKREFVVHEMKQKITTTETYENLALDKKPDASKFEWPK